MTSIERIHNRNKWIVIVAVALVIGSVIAFNVNPYYQAGAVIVGGWSSFILVFAAWAYWPRS